MNWLIKQEWYIKLGWKGLTGTTFQIVDPIVKELRKRYLDYGPKILIFLLGSYGHSHTPSMAHSRSMGSVLFVKPGSLTKGNASVPLTSYTNLFKTAAFYNENVIYLIYKICCRNEEVNCTEPSTQFVFPVACIIQIF
jgi:hypothetical protein